MPQRALAPSHQAAPRAQQPEVCGRMGVQACRRAVRGGVGQERQGSK